MARRIGRGHRAHDVPGRADHDLPILPGAGGGAEVMKITGLSPFVLVCMALGFAFLYAPIIMLIIFSFNASRLVTVWAGFSTKWYVELLRDDQVLGAAYLSFRIAFLHATLSVILGTLAAVALVRFGRFFGRLVPVQL